MSSITETLSLDHRQCDALFAEAEECASAREWSAVGKTFGDFRRRMERHFRMEEQALFPAFQAQTGNIAGPTQVMRLEHEQMRTLFGELAEAAAGADRERYLGLSETLLMLMQQHNVKEEQVLYRMSDRALAPQVSALLERMREID